MMRWRSHKAVISVTCRSSIKIHAASQAPGPNWKPKRYAGYRLAEDLRYNERSRAEPVNGRLKDDFGGRCARARGHAKVLCHLTFGILALTCDGLSRLIVRPRSVRRSI
jgi:hypothetical protein